MPHTTHHAILGLIMMMMMMAWLALTLGIAVAIARVGGIDIVAVIIIVVIVFFIVNTNRFRQFLSRKLICFAFFFFSGGEGEKGGGGEGFWENAFFVTLFFSLSFSTIKKGARMPRYPLLMPRHPSIDTGTSPIYIFPFYARFMSDRV